VNHWLLWAVLAYIAVDLCVGGRMTSAAVGATTGAVRGGIAGRRAETDRILAETEGGRRTLARRQVRRRKNAAVRAGVREGVRTGARHGLDARDAWQRRAGHTVRVGGKAARVWVDKTNPGAWIGLGSAILDAVPDPRTDTPARSEPPADPGVDTPSTPDTPGPPPVDTPDTDPSCRTCGGDGVIAWDDDSDVLCPDCDTPDTPFTTTTKETTTMTASATEVGAAGYLQTLTDVSDRIEVILDDVRNVSRTLLALSEQGAAYDPGQGQEAAAGLAAASDSLAAACEAVEGWHDAAVQEHSAAIEAANGSTSEALQSYAGSQ